MKSFLNVVRKLVPGGRPARDARRSRPVRLGLESLDQRIVPSSSSSNIHAVTDGTGASVAFYRDITNRLYEKTDSGLLQGLTQPGEVSVFSAGLNRYGNADVFAVKDGRLQYYTDGGGGWQDTMAPVAEYSFAAVKGGRMYMVGTDHSLWEYNAPYTTTTYLVIPGHAPVPSTVHWAGSWQEILGPNSMNDVDAVTDNTNHDTLFGRDVNFRLSEFILGTTSHLITLTTAQTNDYSAGLDVGGYADVFAVFPNLSNGRQADLKEYDAGAWIEVYNTADEFTFVSATSGGKAYFTRYVNVEGQYYEGVMGYYQNVAGQPGNTVYAMSPVPTSTGAGVEGNQIAAAGPNDLFEICTDDTIAEYNPNQPGGLYGGWHIYT
jgi:hypothetical protein